MSKGNFLLDDQWKSLFVDLPDEKAGQLIKAAFCYHTGDEVEIDDPVLAAVFSMVRERIDENDRKYQETCQKRAEAGQRGGEAKKANASKGKQKVANASKGKQNVPDSEYDNDIKEKVSPNGDTKKKSTRFVPPTRDQVKSYIAEKGYPVDAERFVDHYTSNGWMVGRTHMKDWRAAVRNWARSPNDKPRSGTTNRFNNYDQRSYDYDALETALLTKQAGG